MIIEINSQRENEDDITVFWTLTDDEGVEYPWHGDIPKGVDVQEYLDSKIPEYLLLIRKREYRAAPDMDLETMEEWIKDGAMLRDEEGKYTANVDPALWKSTEPQPSEIDILKARISALEAAAERS